MTTRAQIIAEARTWLGTPWIHQQRVKGPHGGVDCVQFFIAVAQATGVVPEAETFPRDYGRNEDGVTLIRFLNDYLEQIEPDEAKPADMLALVDEELRNMRVPRHVVAVTEVKPSTTYIIHASEHGVREHRIDRRWRQRIHSAWRIKNLNE